MVTENVNIVVTTRGTVRATRGIQSIGRSSRLATTAVRGLGIALTAAFGAATVGSILRVSDAATEVGNRIRTVTNSTEVFASVQQRLFEVSNRTGQSIADSSRLFQRLSVGTRDLGVGTERLVNVVEGLNASLLVSGSTAREASAALLQLGQGLASDNLSGEELRSLRENLPPLAQALADELGTGIGNLKELGRQGKLNAETVFPALERAVASFTERLRNGEVVFTFAQAFNAVRNEIIRFFSILQRATPVTQTLTKAIFDFADGLAERLVAGLANGLRAAVGLSSTFEAVRAGISRVTTAVRVLADLFGLFKDIVNLAVNSIITGFATARNGLARFANGLTRLGRAVGLRGGIFSDEEAAAQAARVRESQAFLEAAAEETRRNLGDVGAALGFGVEEGVAQAEAALTPFQQGLLDLADSLEGALTAPRADREDAAGPDFFERAARNTSRIQQDAGFEATDIPQDLSESISLSFQEGLRAGLEGGDFLGTLRSSLEQASTDALLKGFQTSIDQAQGILEEAFNSAAEALGPALSSVFGEAAGPLGQALSGALQFVALQGLTALLGGGGNQATSSSANVESAVTSTQAVRGIVAGPTEIAIANVGRNIAEAIDPLLEETRVQTGILSGILDATRAGIGSSGGDTTDTASLAFGSAPAAAI